jgi:N-acetylneuraminic acid mutarotase
VAIAPVGDVFEYDAGTDQWTQMKVTAPENLQIAIPVSTYGVVLFLSLEPAMYVYRHTAP